MHETIEWAGFEAVELRVGTVTKVRYFPQARQPTYQVWVDFSEQIGVKNRPPK